jgi:hypothetical protein
MRGLGVSAVLLILGGTACPSRQDAAASNATGIKVPLPPGWVAVRRGEQGLSAGPPGNPLVLIERRKLTGALPSPAELRSRLAQDLPEVPVVLELGSNEVGRSAALLKISPPSPDGGGADAPPPRFAVLALTQTLAAGTLWCSTSLLDAADARRAYSLCSELAAEADTRASP